MFKKTISFVLSLLFVLTAFGAATVFGGALGASAEFFDYYQYTPFPGLDAFTAEDFELAWLPRSSYGGRTSDFMPDDSAADSVMILNVDTTDQWGGCSVSSVWLRNVDAENNTLGKDLDGPNWAAKSKPNGKDIFGDTGLTFENANGFCFWVGHNGGVFNGTARIAIFNIPAKGPYYAKSEDGSTDMADYEWGFLYESDQIRPDQDGYFYYDFKTEFKQVDWWSKDDDGVNQYNKGKTPVPESKIPQINGIQIRFDGLQAGDVLYIGDWRMYADTRIHADELDEQVAVFDALDPEAYTEESYAAATEIYLQAYEMLQDTTGYVQKQFDAMTRRLRNAIRDLKPMFKAAKNDVKLAGFEVWDEEDFDAMAEGDICLDSAAIDDENVPKNSDQSVLIMATAHDGEPTYGWSLFTNAAMDGDDVIAIKDPFELQEGSEPLSTASGIRFWVKWSDSLRPAPDSMRIGLGVSSEDIFFECEEYSIELPETQGYVGVAWSNFYDIEGDADIFDYIDELDIIAIYLEYATGIYYIADLGGFEWSTSPADFTPLIKAINDAGNYLASMNENNFSPKSWERVTRMIASAEELMRTYAVTDEEVEAAVEAIQKALSRLTLIGNVADRPTTARLEALYKSGLTYWRGNVTPASYRELQFALEEAEELIAEECSQANAEASIARLEAAIAGLVPIKAGEKVTSIFSFESYTGRDLNKATGDATPNVTYELNTTFSKLPEGYAKALKMTAMEDMSAENEDEHGILQFKSMYRDKSSDRIIPIKMGTPDDPQANTLMGDLTGTDGICLWVGVNDMALLDKGTMRFAVSNCEVSPLFERATTHIPMPATGSGWLYLPWEYFEYYDDWTHGQDIDLAKIYFYIIRFNGEVKQGLEVYVTGIHAYKNVSADEWETPVVSNIADGGVYDVSEQPLVPEWNAGAAMLDGAYFLCGSDVPKNGEHVLEITNGDKKTSVAFTVTGGVAADATPVVTGVAEGGVYEEPVTVNWDVGEATLNGVAVEAGVVVEEPGEYVLEVVNGTKSVIVRFEIKAVAPPPEVKRGDMDGDNEITVADALRALRIAAKLVAPTDNDAATGDIDRDGDITVADALKILRVAAKLAGEDSLA